MNMILPSVGPASVRARIGLKAAIQLCGLTDGLKLCLDAGDSASYSSGQKWLDLSGGGYDFFLGATSSSEGSDPTFNGTAGRNSISEFFSFDGGDYFRYDSTNEGWMDDLHQSNAEYSFVSLSRVSDVTQNHPWFGDNGGITTNTGIHVASINPGYGPATRVANSGSTVANKLFGLSSNPYVDDVWNFTGASMEASGGTSSYCYTTSGNQVVAGDSTGLTYSSPSAGSATYTMEIGARGNGNSPMPSGAGIASLAIWSKKLSQAQLLALLYATRGKFSY